MKRGAKLPPTCPCGQPSIKQLSGFHTCQRCLDADQMVAYYHRLAAESRPWLTQEEAYEKMKNAKGRSVYYYRHRYQL